ncbi:hypothetical protein E3P99_02050 [Wallemia hederae]|uniref:AB hydrolase-1 domain-containing protein n=1 Tax=Wallemia hederae TaxID=1540922 RepID=A0A4T0FLL3_9BASI|nr:hypothetical protein E3P99_02050 [Wallemia hederae]
MGNTWNRITSNLISSTALIFVVIYALISRFYLYLTTPSTPSKRREWDDYKKYKNELITPDTKYYANQIGFDIVHQRIYTQDGYELMVYLGNTRGVYNTGHKHLKKNDPKFWDYTIEDLAEQDLPCLIDHVKEDSNSPHLSFIGHSQGNGLAFMSLSLDYCPHLSNSISSFIALAPAVYAGPLTTGFPFTAIKDLDWKGWRVIFGDLDFIPLMTLAFNYTPKRAFALLGYQMFAFLFSWTDKNWLNRRKAKMFRFTPSPVSSKSVHWWAGKDGFSTRGCTLETSKERWFSSGEETDKSGIKIPKFPPLSLYVGTDDKLVLVEPLLERLKTHENIKLRRVDYFDGGEHCDFFWAADAVEICFHKILQDIQLGVEDMQ